MPPRQRPFTPRETPNWPPHQGHMHIPPRFAHREKPHWWPENEPWPPPRRIRHHNPFFRRLGCAFAIANLLGWTLLLVIAGLLAHFFGVIHLAPMVMQWVVPLGLVVFIFIIGLLLLVAFFVRRSFNPLDNLLTAAERVAEGDYTVQVGEKGPGGVRSLTRAFNKMAARLHQVDEQRRNLLADVSHELRTPLSVIQGNLEGMLDGVYPADETNLRALLDETHLLSRLIDDLRTLTLAESGALQLKKEPTDPLLLVRETVSAFQSQANAAGVTLTVEGENLPTIAIDAARIRQVLANLITNALRYAAPNDSGGGIVRITCILTGSMIQIAVHDSGPGIAPEDLPHIFERFHKSADSGGTGLGLSIARHIVSAHGGTIHAESSPGQGTTIRVELPLTA